MQASLPGFGKRTDLTSLKRQHGDQWQILVWATWADAQGAILPGVEWGACTKK